MKKRPNILYKILILAFSISCFSEGVIMPIYAVFVQKVGGDILDAGLAMGIFLITEGIFTMLVHRCKWTAKQRTALMIIGWVIWLVGICSYLAISSIWTLFLAQVLTAIGNAVADPVLDEEIADHMDPSLKEFEWGFFEGSKAFVDGSAAIIGAAIAAYLGFHTLIFVMIATATCSLGLILLYIKRLRAVKAMA